MSEKPKKKNKTLGWICAIWGGLVLLNGIPRLLSPPENAYGMGQFVGLLFGAFMLFAGVRELRKPDEQAQPTTPT